MKRSLLLIGLCSGLIACGGSSSSSDPTTVNSETGVFLDSAVANIGYRTATLQGSTNNSGEFDYIDGEDVTFFIGDLELPAVSAKGVVTPLDIAETDDTSNNVVVNIIRLLQTLDEDGDPENGITISDIAKDNASPIDFTLSISEFESSTAVTSLVANSGSTNTTLISKDDAIAHFEDTLIDANEEFVANANISGIWTTSATDNDLLAFVFFADGTYVHLEVDEESPIDEADESSGMEWGTYARDNETGRLTIGEKFNNNGGTGLTDFIGQTTLFAQISGDTLTLQFDDNADGEIGSDEALELSREASSELLGAWATSETDNELLAFVFFDDGTYVHLEVDQEQPIDVVDEISGMEWGTYSRDSESGALTVDEIFDNNGDTGLTDFFGSSEGLAAQVSGDTLTLQFDDNDDGEFSADEALELQRQ